MGRRRKVVAGGVRVGFVCPRDPTVAPPHRKVGTTVEKGDKFKLGVATRIGMTRELFGNWYDGWRL